MNEIASKVAKFKWILSHLVGTYSVYLDLIIKLFIPFQCENKLCFAYTIHLHIIFQSILSRFGYRCPRNLIEFIQLNEQILYL